MISLTLWDVLCALCAFVTYTLLPGAGLIYFLRRKHPVKLPQFIALSIGGSLALNALVAYGAHFSGGTLAAYGVVMIGLAIVAIIYLLVSLTWENIAIKLAVNAQNLLFLALVGLVSIIWFIVILQNGPRIDYGWDQWFHIAHVQEGLERNLIVPPNPFWADVALSETHGLWHMVLAAMGRTFRLETLTLWRVGNAYLAGLAFIVVYAVSTMIIEEPATSFLAAVVFLGSGVGAMEITRTFIYPWGSSHLCLLLSLGQFFRYWKTGTKHFLLTATISGLMPVFIHPQEYILLCFALLSLGGSAILLPLIFRQPKPINSKKIWISLLLLLVLGTPLLFFHYSNRIVALQQDAVKSGFNPNLPLYEHPLAVLLAAAFPYFWKIGLLYFAVMNFNIISLLSLKMLPVHLDTKTRWFLTTLTWAPMAAALVPGVSWLAQKVLLETYSWRLLNLVPSPIIWALLIRKWLPFSPRVERESGLATPPVEKSNWVYIVLGSLLLSVVVFSIAYTVAQDEMEPAEGIVAAEDLSPLQSRGVFDRLDQLLAEPGIVLSDPTTSYAVPGLTKHHVVLNEPSHGSRDDLLLRFVETRELLSSPVQSAAAARATLQRYGVDFIVVNKLWLDETFMAEMPFYSEYTLEFLRDNPTCFQLVYRDASFEAFQYLQCAPADIRHKGLPSEANVSAEDIEYVKPYRFTDNLSLLGFSLPDGQSFTPGVDLPMEVYWQADASISEPYAVWLELLCAYPGERLPYGRLLRRARELATGSLFLVEDAAWLLPPPSGLERGDIFKQVFTLQMPPNLVADSCGLNLYVLNQHQALHDQEILPVLLMEKGYNFTGVQLQSVEVEH